MILAWLCRFKIKQNFDFESRLARRNIAWDRDVAHATYEEIGGLKLGERSRQ